MILVLTGLRADGVIAGTQMVLACGLDFPKPFGTRIDAILIPLILIFSVYMAIYLWQNRSLFE